MSLRSKLFFIVLLVFISCNEKKIPKQYLINVLEYNQLLKKDNVKIIDFRKSEEYKKGHVKNAINIWRTDIEDNSLPYAGMKASKEQLEKLFRNLGIKSDDTLIVYDDKGLCDAARLWWVLQYYNFSNVKLLDGGFVSLQKNNTLLTKEPTSFKASNFSFIPITNDDFYANKKQIENAIIKGNHILDTRTKDEYIGNVLKKGAYIKGRISTSKHFDWANAINYSKDNKTKTIKELESIYNKILPNKNDTIYVYCHSGVRSAHTTFVLTQILGYKNVRNYDGSWIEWSYYKKNKTNN